MCCSPRSGKSKRTIERERKRKKGEGVQGKQYGSKGSDRERSMGQGANRLLRWPCACSNPPWPVFLTTPFLLCFRQTTPVLLSDGSPALSSLSEPLKCYLPDHISLKDSKQSPIRNWFQEEALLGPFITLISELRTWRERARRGDERKGF